MQWSKSSAHGCHGMAFCAMWDVIGNMPTWQLCERESQNQVGVCLSVWYVILNNYTSILLHKLLHDWGLYNVPSQTNKINTTQPSNNFHEGMSITNPKPSSLGNNFFQSKSKYMHNSNHHTQNRTSTLVWSWCKDLLLHFGHWFHKSLQL
jgi:hypothetical protein